MSFWTANCKIFAIINAHPRRRFQKGGSKVIVLDTEYISQADISLLTLADPIAWNVQHVQNRRGECFKVKAHPHYSRLSYLPESWDKLGNKEQSTALDQLMEREKRQIVVAGRFTGTEIFTVAKDTKKGS